MSSYDAFCRAPLLNPAYAPLSTAACRPQGWWKAVVERALRLCADEDTLSEKVLCARLRQTGDLPAAPLLPAGEMALGDEPRAYVRNAVCAMHIAVQTRDKDAMLALLESMETVADALPALSHGQKLLMGAELTRLTVELYRRTGQKFLLELLDALRAELPDWAGYFHAYPQLKPYAPDTAQDAPADADEAAYRRHMRRMARGRAQADGLAVTALLAQYSGSAREVAAGKAGLSALDRFHGAPTGMFLSAPFLAGRDPSQPMELRAACHLAQALCDIIAFGGKSEDCDRLERVLCNVIAPALRDGAALCYQPVSALMGAEKTEKYLLSERKTCAPVPAGELSASERIALLRALDAIRQTVWMAGKKDELTLLLPLDGTCVTRVSGVPVRLTVEGGFPYTETVTVRVECKQRTDLTLSLRIPGYADDATVQVGDEAPQGAAAGKCYTIARVFEGSETITLHLPIAPRLEKGMHASCAVLCGDVLMALPGDGEWRMAIDPKAAIKWNADSFTCVCMAAPVPAWEQKGGFPAVPPQGVKSEERVEVTLSPAAASPCRVALLPQVNRA